MISLQNVKKIYKGDGYETIALNGIDLEINKGEFVAIMGKSGSGKSTLLNIIGCMDRLSSGKYIIDEKDVSKVGTFALDKIRKKKIGFIFQNYELIEQYTVYENIELPLLAARDGYKQRIEKIDAAMKLLSIADLQKKYPRQISGGEQQRTAIARALVSENEYLLADEPTGALDEENSLGLMKLFKSIHESGKTIIMVTHDSDIASFADRIIHIADGKIV